MKNIFLLSLLVISSLSSLAQPVLNESNFSGANDQFVFTTLVDMNLDYSSTGANYTWDFSTIYSTTQRWQVNKPISEAGQFSAFMFGSFAAAPYQASYFTLATELPLAEMTQGLPVTFEEISQFTKNTSTSINSIGYEFVINGQGIPAKSDTIEHRYDLPLEYGDSYDSRGYTKLNMNPIYDAQWRQHRYRQSVVDGWGTVITPFGTFTALRINHTISEIDSFYVQNTWVGIPIPLSHVYEWRSADEKEPVMKITTNEIGGNEVITNVEYRDNYNGLSVTENTVTLALYPNPVSTDLRFELSSKAKNVSIIDAKGRVVLQNDVNAFDGTIDISTFAAGQYHAVFVTETGVTSQEFIKK